MNEKIALTTLAIVLLWGLAAALLAGYASHGLGIDTLHRVALAVGSLGCIAVAAVVLKMNAIISDLTDKRR
jgi:hypothetical protein